MLNIPGARSAVTFLMLLSAAMSACAGNRPVREMLRERWVGERLDRFTAEYGEPQSEYTLDNGDTAYLWNSGSGVRQAPDYAVSRLYGDYSHKQFPGAGNINLLCEARIVAGGDGVIREFDVMRDTPGARIGSRCREVFGKK